jgi:hypothetical protein
MDKYEQTWSLQIKQRMATVNDMLWGRVALSGQHCQGMSSCTSNTQQLVKAVGLPHATFTTFTDDMQALADGPGVHRTSQHTPCDP